MIRSSLFYRKEIYRMIDRVIIRLKLVKDGNVKVISKVIMSLQVLTHMRDREGVDD